MIIVSQSKCLFWQNTEQIDQPAYLSSPVVLCNLMKVVVIKVLDLQLRRTVWTFFFVFGLAIISKIQHPKATIICNLEIFSMHNNNNIVVVVFQLTSMKQNELCGPPIFVKSY